MFNGLVSSTNFPSLSLTSVLDVTATDDKMKRIIFNKIVDFFRFVSLETFGTMSEHKSTKHRL